MTKMGELWICHAEPRLLQRKISMSAVKKLMTGRNLVGDGDSEYDVFQTLG